MSAPANPNPNPNPNPNNRPSSSGQKNQGQAGPRPPKKTGGNGGNGGGKNKQQGPKGQNKPQQNKGGCGCDVEDEKVPTGRASKIKISKEDEAKVKYVDSHVHIDYIMQKLKLPNYQALKSSYGPMYEASVCVFCDPAAFSPSFGVYNDLLAEADVYGSFGCHPHNAKFFTEKMQEMMMDCLSHPKCVSLGECGLDYHYNNSPKDVQQEVFARQLRMAVALKKPVVVHSREAFDDTLRILKENLPAEWLIHIHCFGDGPNEAQQYCEAFPNLCIGFTGVITFKTAIPQQEAVKALDLNRILLHALFLLLLP